MRTRIKNEQPHYRRGKRRKQSSTTTSTSPRTRQGDRGSKDDAAAPPGLPVYIRFRDLVASGIVHNWQNLYRMIDQDGFPSGRLLGPNSRAWTVAEVQTWLDGRPTVRRPQPQQRRVRDAAADKVSA